MRLEQVRAALEEGLADPEEIVGRVYGAALPSALRPAATAAVVAYLEHLRGDTRARGADS